MLIRYSAENYRSIRDSQQLSLVAGSGKELPETLILTDRLSYPLLRVAAIYGANASGKSNVLRSLFFVKDAIANSHRSWEPDGGVPRQPFAFDDSVNKPSTFEVEALVDDVRYRYGFSINDRQVTDEWLFAYPKRSKQKWFERTGCRNFWFNPRFPGANRSIEKLTRDNSLFLSTAAQNNHEALLPLFNWITKSVAFIVGPRGQTRATNLLCKHPNGKELLLKYLRAADIGVVDVTAEEIQVPLPQELRERLEKIDPDISKELETTTKVSLFHKAAGREPVPLPIEEESQGTVAYYSLIGPMLAVLTTGGVLVVDELDSSLHPLLSVELVRIFNDPKRNPKNAQLLFNTHDTALLGTCSVRRDQIWFTERDEDAATHLYSLQDFSPRKSVNLQRGYLQGRYGAVPFINSEMLGMTDQNAQ